MFLFSFQKYVLLVTKLSKNHVKWFSTEVTQIFEKFDFKTLVFLDFIRIYVFLFVFVHGFVVLNLMSRFMKENQVLNVRETKKKIMFFIAIIVHRKLWNKGSLA